MKRYKFSDVQIGEIKTLLELNWSFSVIIRNLKAKGIIISKGHLSNIKNTKENPVIERKEMKRTVLSQYSQVSKLTAFETW